MWSTSASTSKIVEVDGDQVENARNDINPVSVKVQSPSDDADADAWHDTLDVLPRAEELKAEGNKLFSSGKLDEAIEVYTVALANLPRKIEMEDKGKSKALDIDDGDSDNAKEGDNEGSVERVPETGEDATEEVQREEIVELRSTLNANVAACYFKQERWKEVVDACSKALDDRPLYLKALQRRAMANEKIDSWSSLSSALEDWKVISTIQNVPPSVRSSQRSALVNLPPRLEERKTKETAEMMSKLKDLGNSFLGKFGMSTDNFKFTPNASGEGYSMNFVR